MGRLTGKTARESDSFMGNLAGSRFYLLRGGMLCAVRTVGLLRAVAQFFHKLLHHLPLYGGCDLMFWLLVLWTVISLSNVWNKNHLLNGCKI